MSFETIENPKLINKEDLKCAEQLILIHTDNGTGDKEIFHALRKDKNLFSDKKYMYIHVTLNEIPDILDFCNNNNIEADILHLTLSEKGRIKNLVAKLLKNDKKIVAKYGLEELKWYVTVDEYNSPQIFLMKEDGYAINEDETFVKIAETVQNIISKDKEKSSDEKLKMLDLPQHKFHTIDLSELSFEQQQDSIWKLFRKPVRPLKQPTCFSPKIGDIVPFRDNRILCNIPEKDEDRYINRISSLGEGNQFRILEELGIDTSGFEQKYTCPHTEMEFYSLVPMFLISKNLEIYKRKTSFSKMTFDKKYLWWLQDPEEMYHPSKTERVMLGSGYTCGTSYYDGCSEYVTTAIELENGDHLICLTWEWFNN